jgi:hypothetical protein
VAKLLSKDEARRIASNIAKLPVRVAEAHNQISGIASSAPTILVREGQVSPGGFMGKLVLGVATLAIMVSGLLMGGASFATAQNAPATGGQAPGGAAINPAASSTAASIPARTARHHGTRHHRIYMMSVNRTHKGSKLTPANAKPQMKQ